MKLFRTFRRHQKVAFALLTLMAMISFVILPIVLDIIQSRSGINPVIVRTKTYGVLHRNELAMLMFQRQKIVAFLQAIHGQVARARLASTSSSAVPPVTQAQIMLGQIGPADEEAVANTWLLSQRARQLGIQVSDTTISNTIARLLERQVSQQSFRDILRELQLTEDSLFEYLRQELLALRVEELFNVSLVGTPPAQQWDYFLRMNRKARIEALGVPVADFVAQVSEPTEAEVRELFARYKHQEPDPTSPNPGFRRPHRVAIEYFRADYSRFVDPSKVTEEEIRKYYEENKDFEFVEPETPPAGTAPPPQKPAEKPADKPAEKAADKPAAKPAEKVLHSAKPSLPAQSGGQAPHGEEQGAKNEQRERESKGGKAAPPGTPKPAAQSLPGDLLPEKPAPEKPAADGSGGSSAGQGRKTSAVTGRGVMHLVAYGASKEKPAEGAVPAKSPAKAAPATDVESPKSQPAEPQAKSADTKASPQKPGESQAAPSSPSAATSPETKPGEPKPSAAKSAESKAGQSTPGEGKPTETKPAEPKPRKYKPLEAVRDQIRTLLAQRASETRAEEVLQRLEAPLREYELKWLEHAKQKGAGPGPQRPNLKEWAAKYGITANATGLITVWEVGNFDIARSLVDGQRSFTEVAFGPLNLYQRMRSKDVEGNASFLFWKVEDDPERDVELDEPGVREQVVEAWKFRAARPLARQEAERLANEARKAGQSLKQAFASRGMKVVEPEPFSWLTFGVRPPPLSTVEARLNSVSGIDAAGEEFMAAVFSLEPGQVGTAMNHPQTVAYVVRVLEYLPPWDVLWNDFVKRGMEFFRLVARREIEEARLAWLDEIKAQAGFEWVEPPRRREHR